MESSLASTEAVGFLFALGLSCARILGFLAIFPLTSAQFFPPVARNGLAIVIGGFVMPQVFPVAMSLKIEPALFVLLGFKEVAIGTLFGFALGTLVWTFEAVGSFVEFQSGSANSQVFDPLSGSEAGLLSRFFVQLAILLFLALGGLELFLRVLMESYSLWPADQWLPQFSRIAMEVGRAVSLNFWSMLFKYTISVMVCVYLVDIFFGITGRYAPQLNLFQLSLPVKSAVILLVLVAIVPSMAVGFEGSLLEIVQILNSALAVR